MPTAPRPRPRSLARLLACAAAFVVALTLVTTPPPSPAAALPGLAGEGSDADPYQIASPEHLRTVAEAINADPGAYAGAHYRLVADIDVAGQPIAPIDTFSGVFDGAGHVISDLSITEDTASGDTRTAFIRRNSGVVRHLWFDGFHYSSTAVFDGPGPAVATIVGQNDGGIVQGNAVTDALLDAPGLEKVAGIVGQTHGGEILDNYFQGEVVSRYMPAGIVSYVNDRGEIRRNLVDADLVTVESGGVRGTNAGLVATYPNGATVAENVALDGAIDYTGTIDGHAGRIVGWMGFANVLTLSDNLASETVTIAGEPVSGGDRSGQQGETVSAAALADQATYQGLGWDFAARWTWDEERGHPVPAYVGSLPGEGTASLPYEIGSVADLEHLAHQLNAGDTRYSGGRHFRLTADLDFSEHEPFGGIDRFDGTLDGAGHTISGLVYASGEDGDDAERLGLIRHLDGGTVENLTLDGVTAESDSPAGWVAGIAVVAEEATLRGNAVIDAELRAPAAEKAAGLVAELHGGSVHDNWVRGTVVAERMPAGIVSYARHAVELRHNLVQTDLEVVADGGPAGTRGIDAAHVIAYPGNPNRDSSFTGNVAHSGEIDYRGQVDGFAGRIVGYTGFGGWTAEANLAHEDITIGGEPVAAPGPRHQHGADASAEALADQATYQELGWDFEEAWRFDDERGHPVPRYISPLEAPNRVTTTFHGDAATQRAFTWYSTIETDEAVVRLSTDREFPEGGTVEVAAERETSGGGETFYRAVATGLQPGTTYHYRVGDARESVWSPAGTFRTAEGGAEEFTFVALTDTEAHDRGEAEVATETIDKALRYVPDAEFLVHGGDLVADGSDEAQWQQLLDGARASLRSTTLAPAAGRGEAEGGAFADHFTLGTPNGQNTSTGVYYSYTYNRAHIMVLNTNEGGAQGISAEQLDWLRADAEAAREAGAEWLILTMHKGVYTSGEHAGDEDVMAMRRTLVPVIDELGIDLVLQGQDHVMSRTRPLAADPGRPEGARPAEATVITEMRHGKRIQYAVDPDGTFYLLPNTAGPRHGSQATEVPGADLEAYLRLFDRTDTYGSLYNRPRMQNFAAVTVGAERLTVETYEIRDRGVPRLFEGFGIDRAPRRVDDTITALPEPADVTAGDAAAIEAARGAVDALTSAQRGALSELPRLEEAERRLREVLGLVSPDGSEVAWADPEATSRQIVTVRNDTKSTFEDTPVRLRIPDTPDTEALTLVTPEGVPLPHEVETWRPGDTSTIWVRLPRVAAETTTTLWAYFGGSGRAADPAAVWAEDYALVEHFGDGETDGERVDSTGRNRGAVVGEPLDLAVSARGTGQARLGATRLQYGSDVGGDFDRIAVSGIYSLTPEELSSIDGLAPVVAKERADGQGRAAFHQGVHDDGRAGTRLAGNSFEFGDVDHRHRHDLAVDGEPHLVTHTYDGMTYSVFVDGQEVHAEFLEYRTTFADPGVPVTIGDFATAEGSLAAPFPGTVEEVQIAGIPFTPDFEAFRYATLLGDAVAVGPRTDRDAEGLALIVGSPASGSQVEAGLVEVAGTVSKRAVLTAELAGEEVFRQTVDAGQFAVPVPVDEPGERALTVRAHAAGDIEDAAAAEVPLTVSDTVAPAPPEVSDDAATATGDPAEVTLSATPRTESRERVEVEFYAGPAIELDESNVTVRTGSTPDRLPDGLGTDSGTVSEELLPTTVGEDENPFQIYEIALTEEQARQEEFQLVWTGTADRRQVAGYVYDHAAGEWLLKDTGADPHEGGQVALDITARGDEGAVTADGILHVLIWRGLTELPTGEDHDYEAMPDPALYDWAFDHVGDTQLYAQATPQIMNHQFEHIADVAEERKTALVVHAGDWVNRPYLSQEYQWRDTQRSAEVLEENGIPYMVTWGNHDYRPAGQRNGRVMLQEYFPLSRFEESVEGTEWEFGGSHDIENYYYTAEIGGAKLLFLTIGFFSADNPDRPGIAWAREVVEAHPDHTVIFGTHDIVNHGVNRWVNQHTLAEVVDPHDNVRLVLGGHIAGTGVAWRETAHEDGAWGILTDHQGRVYGGEGYYKHLSVDMENDLMYVNTYSPWLDSTSSDGQWNQPVPPGSVPGLHGSDTENFVLEIDLGGSTTRTLATDSLSFAGERQRVGEPQEVVGATPASATLDGVEAGTPYSWYAELRDPAGHVTRSELSVFTVSADADPEEPGTDPEEPGTDPEEPGTDPEEPGTDPEEPGTDPEGPGTDPEGPGADPGRPGGPGGPGGPAAEDLVAELEDEIDVPSVIVRGEDVTVGVGERHGGSEVSAYLFSDPVELGTATATPGGLAVFTVPVDTPLGEHRLAVYDAGGELIGWAVTTVVDPDGVADAGQDGAAGGLGVTGAQVAALAAGAALLLLLGAAALTMRNRRAAAGTEPEGSED